MKPTSGSSIGNSRAARPPILPSPPTSTAATFLRAKPFLTDWMSGLRRIRANISARRWQLVERLSLALPAPGAAEEAACEGLAERLLASDPTAEAAHRALIRIHAHRGHENAALRQFELCRAALKKHLDAEPEAQTNSLAASLQSRERSRTSADCAGRRRRSAAAGLVSPGPKQHDRPSVAVMPFQNLSGDAEQEYFADGIVEDIITALAHFRHLFVIARNSSFTYKGRAVDMKQVGRELDVRYVVEGSVRRAGDRLRITGQLIDASTGAHLWADRFDGTLAEVFDLQDQVASSIVGAITPKVEEAEIERAKRKPTESLDAYDYYLRGLATFDRTISRAAIDDALRLFNEGDRPRPGVCPGPCQGGAVLRHSKEQRLDGRSHERDCRSHATGHESGRPRQGRCDCAFVRGIRAWLCGRRHRGECAPASIERLYSTRIWLWPGATAAG